MRNLWYPTKKAEYMTSTRFQELGLTRSKDIGERDPMFRAYDNGTEDASEDALEQQAGEEDSSMPAFSLAVRFISLPNPPYLYLPCTNG